METTVQSRLEPGKETNLKEAGFGPAAAAVIAVEKLLELAA